MTHGHQGAFESLEGMGSKIGSGSIAASRFEIGFRRSDTNDGRAPNMIEGHADDAPKSRIPTSKASDGRRVERKARKFRRGFARAPAAGRPPPAPPGAQ